MAVPILGSLANILMLLAVIYLGVLGGGDTRVAAVMSIVATVVWFAVAGVSFVSAQNAWSPGVGAAAGRRELSPFRRGLTWRHEV